nr:hypothetical protein Iba_chr07cCG8540 [Ipomoea batatas]
MTDDSSTAKVACLSIIEGILATAASRVASGIPSIPMVVEIANSSITSSCNFEIVRTPPVSTTVNSYSPQKDLPYKRSLVTPDMAGRGRGGVYLRFLDKLQMQSHIGELRKWRLDGLVYNEMCEKLMNLPVLSGVKDRLAYDRIVTGGSCQRPRKRTPYHKASEYGGDFGANFWRNVTGKRREPFYASENICSANKEVLEFDSAMAAMEVDSEQTFGKTTYENAKTPTMQRHFIESLSTELKLSPAVEAVALSAVRRRNGDDRRCSGGSGSIEIYYGSHNGSSPMRRLSGYSLDEPWDSVGLGTFPLNHCRRSLKLSARPVDATSAVVSVRRRNGDDRGC